MPADARSLRAIFDRHDRDNRGSINLSEFRRLLAELGSTRTPVEVKADFHALDERGDELVGFFEFARWWEVRSAFDQHDGDDNGAIDLREFRRLVAELGSAKTSAEVEAEFDALDRDANGLLEFFEFEQWWRVRNVFDRVDTDRDGTIDLLEFRRLMAALGSVRSPAEVEADFDTIDRDEGGLLDFTEFAHWWTVRSAFDRTDKDRRGAIDRVEFGHLLNELGSVHAPADVDAEFGAIDRDEDGLVEFSELAIWLRERAGDARTTD